MTTASEEGSRKSIGKYSVIGVLGRGSMGVVYRAQDPEIGRTVAIKVLRKIFATPTLSMDSALERFKTEAKSAGNLRHPNIITVFEVSRDGDTPFIVMDYVEGEGLDSIIKRDGKIPPHTAISFLSQVASGLDYAHSRGVIHKDIKPANLIVDKQGNIYILDFGVASMSDSLSEPDGTGKGPVMGTPGYMSPEQIRNDRVEARGDLFSLAIVFFEALTGVRPFAGDNATVVIGNILRSEPLRATTANPSLPPGVDAEFQRALSKDPSTRFGSAKEFLAALTQALAPVLVRPAPKKESATFGVVEPGSRPPPSSKANVARWSDEIPMSQMPQNMGNKLPATVPLLRGGRVDMHKGVIPPPSGPGKKFSARSSGIFSSQYGESALQAAVGWKKRGLRKGVLALCVIILLVGIGGGISLLSVAQSFLESLQGGAKDSGDSKLPQRPLSAGEEVKKLKDRELLSLIAAGSLPEQRALELLAEAKVRNIPGLADAASYLLINRSSAVRIEALAVMATIGDKLVVPKVIAQLNDLEPSVRLQVIKALVTLGDKKAMPALTTRLAIEENNEVKNALTAAIEKMSGFQSSFDSK